MQCGKIYGLRVSRKEAREKGNWKQTQWRAFKGMRPPYARIHGVSLSKMSRFIHIITGDASQNYLKFLNYRK